MKKLLIAFILISISLCGCVDFKSIENYGNYQNYNNFVNTHEHYYGKVVKVVDGDTVYVNVNGELWKIRLLGVDTPETYKKNNPHEYYLLNGTPITNTTYLKIWGEKAKYFAKKQLENKTVIIVFDNEAPKKDKYGRYLAYIFINNSNNLINFNEELLKYGYARVYISNFELKDEFLEVEREAKENRIGLWNWHNN
ncbi:nuclease (SNase domain protein) [Methanocaldococcus bathoardescens]|uniref:Nuclease (SNase domain protein) n=1 Tax=Methanocaldococcus bathoardescens TaxID=1301915 RepID=A0A076LG06_9EURY|nr:thermonuclease family protein [Methanocaldococcus bathoardescens]AIJ05413.1 nuclease (SNase domain protein) [Methanocaldococcus bathoardescens]